MDSTKRALPKNREAEMGPAGNAQDRFGRLRWLTAVAALLVSALLTVSAASAQDTAAAFPASASSGELFFYPCTSCHPIPREGKQKLPNGFSGHGIVLTAHGVLGGGSAACAACHSGGAENPGMLKGAGGASIDITGDVSRVCSPCHAAVYREWKSGMHGTGRNKCSAAGCHDPHTPEYVYSSGLLPFVGVGFQAKVLPDSSPFEPFASPPPHAPAITPRWLMTLASIGAMAAVGMVGILIMGRPPR
jgi:hypothetical protein